MKRPSCPRPDGWTPSAVWAIHEALRRAVTTLMLAGSLGCSAEKVPLPFPFPDGMTEGQFEVLAADFGSRFDAYYYPYSDVAFLPIELNGDEELSLEVFVYDQAIPSLKPGLMELDKQAGDALVDPSHSFSAKISGGEFSGWQKTTSASQLFPQIRTKRNLGCPTYTSGRAIEGDFEGIARFAFTLDEKQVLFGHDSGRMVLVSSPPFAVEEIVNLEGDLLRSASLIDTNNFFMVGSQNQGTQKIHKAFRVTRDGKEISVEAFGPPSQTTQGLRWVATLNPGAVLTLSLEGLVELITADESRILYQFPDPATSNRSEVYCGGIVIDETQQNTRVVAARGARAGAVAFELDGTQTTILSLSELGGQGEEICALKSTPFGVFAGTSGGGAHVLDPDGLGWTAAPFREPNRLLIHPFVVHKGRVLAAAGPFLSAYMPETHDFCAIHDPEHRVTAVTIDQMATLGDGIAISFDPSSGSKEQHALVTLNDP